MEVFMKENFYRYMFDPKKILNPPIDWNLIKNYTDKLIVEIGFGGGEFLAEMAKDNPQSLFVGFETSLTACERAQKKFFKNNLSNILIVNNDARFCLRELFNDNSVDRIIVNFPCPWPKKKHENRRIFVEDFRNTLAAVLKTGGTLELATDVEWYAQEVYDNFKADKKFEVNEIIKNFDRGFKTRYEKKWDEMGRNKFLVKIEKKTYFAVSRFLKEENEMPHSFVQNISEEKLYELKNKDFNEKALHFHVKEVLKSSDRDKYLVQVFSSDDEFHQEYFVLVTKREENWIVKLDPSTVPFRTDSVKFSVYSIAKEIGDEK